MNVECGDLGSNLQTCNPIFTISSVPSFPSQLGMENNETVSLQRGKKSLNECPGYDTKQCDGEVPVMLGYGGMWSTPSLPSLSDSLKPRVVAPDRALSMGQIELNCILILNWIA